MHTARPLVWVFLLLTLLLAPLRAEDLGLPAFNAPLPSEAEILRMGYRGLSAWADTHAPAMNEVQADNLAIWYSRIRERANRQQMRNTDLEAATRALRTWSSHRWNVMYLQAGGGTIFVHTSVRETATIADLEARAIKGWREKGTAGAADAVRSYRSMKVAKTPYNVAPAKAYNEALADEEGSLIALKIMLARLPVGPQRIYARYMSELSRTRFGD